MRGRGIYLCMFCVLAVAPVAWSQQERTLSIGELLRLSDTENAEIKAAISQIKVSEQQERISRSPLLPQLNLSLSVGYLGNGTILDRDFSHPVKDELPHLSNSLGVELYQPLYEGGSIAGGIQMAKKQTQMAGIGLEATRNTVRMMIVGNYLELAKNSNLLAVYEENIRLTEKLLQEMRARYGQGTVLKNDITRYELKLSSLGYDRLATRNAIRICRANLNSLLGWGDSVEIVPDLPEFEPGSLENEDEWLQSALGHAQPLKTYGLQAEMEKIGKKITRAGYIPQIGLLATDNLIGPVTFEIPVLNKNYNAWFVGLSVKWNVSSLYTNHKSMRKHDLELSHIGSEQKAEESSLERRIHEAFTLYGQSVERLAIERKNLQLAKENYSLIEHRYNQQLSLLTDMLDASTARLDAGVRLVNAEISARYYYYQLHFIAGTLIEL